MPNLLTAKDLFGQNEEISKRVRLTDLSAYHADCGYRLIGLLTELGGMGAVWTWELIMRANWLKSLLFFSVVLIASVQARAQPLSPHTESIESTVANADLVFVGKIVKFDPADQEAEAKVYGVTVAFEETLKKKLFRDEPYRVLQIRLPHRPSVITDWKERACRLLVAHNSDAPEATRVIELTHDPLEVMTADMKLLRDPDAVIQAAREAVGQTPAAVKRIHTFGLAVPRKVIVGTTWEKYYHTSGHLFLSVPVDKQLEKRALRYIRSKNTARRWEGLRALRYFKSDKNIARIKALLDDAKSSGVGLDVGNEAEQTLKSWGVEVEKP